MSIFDTIAKLSGTSEKGLLIDISSIRQACVRGEIQNIAQISSEHNLTDPLPKKMNSPMLINLLDTGKIHHPVNKWIVHKDSPSEE